MLLRYPWKIINKILKRVFKSLPYKYNIILRTIYIKITDKKNYKKYYFNYNENLEKVIHKKRQRKKSDVLFIFGSGGSIRNLSKNEIKKIEKYEIFTFNWFAYQNFVKVDYYLIRELSPNDFNRDFFMRYLNRFGYLIERNWHLYKETIFILQNNITAVNSERLMYYRILPGDAIITRFKSKKMEIISSHFPYLSHGMGTLMEAINFAYIVGYKKVILVGVDLYNRDYFWLKKDEVREGDTLRGANKNMVHNTAKGVINFIKYWKNEYFDRKGINLYTYNPKSLLKEVIPVFKWKYLQLRNE